MLSQDQREMLERLRKERGASNRQDVLLALIEEAHKALGNQRTAPRKPKPDGGSQQSLPGV
jgi:hypothetical protein